MILRNNRNRNYNGIKFGEIVELTDETTIARYIEAGFVVEASENLTKTAQNEAETLATEPTTAEAKKVTKKPVSKK